jgi:hypothetical protein
MSSDYGLLRVLLGLLPLSKALSSIFLGRLGRLISKNRKVQAP